MSEDRDWRAYDIAVRDALVEIAQSQLEADQARGLGVGGHYAAHIEGEHPSTQIVISGPGTKSGQPHAWRFAIYEHWGFFNDPPPEPSDLASDMWTDMDD